MPKNVVILMKVVMRQALKLGNQSIVDFVIELNRGYVIFAFFIDKVWKSRILII